MSGIVNKTIFPAPANCSYSRDSHHGMLLMIPRKQTGTHTFGILTRCTRPATHLIIYAHPNAVDMGMMVDEVSYVANNVGAHALLWEYRGYGMLLGEGEPGEEEINFDMESVWDFARNSLGIPASQIILMGRSIGTGPTSRLASRLVEDNESPALLILEAPFTSVRDCVKTLVKQYVPGLADFAAGMVSSRFETIKILHEVRCPVVLVHGVKDDIVEYSHSVQLLESCLSNGKNNVCLHTISDCGHNDIPLSETSKAIRNAIATFLVPGATNGGSHRPQGGKRSSAALPTLALECPAWYLLHASWPKENVASYEALHRTFSALTPTHLVHRGSAAAVLLMGTLSFAYAAAASYRAQDRLWRQEHQEILARRSGQNGTQASTTPRVLASSSLLSYFSLSGGTGKDDYKPRMTVAAWIDLCAAVCGSPMGIYDAYPVPTGGAAAAKKTSPATRSVFFFGIHVEVPAHNALPPPPPRSSTPRDGWEEDEGSQEENCTGEDLGSITIRDLSYSRAIPGFGVSAGEGKEAARYGLVPRFVRPLSAAMASVIEKLISAGRLPDVESDGSLASSQDASIGNAPTISQGQLHALYLAVEQEVILWSSADWTEKILPTIQRCPTSDTPPLSPLANEHVVNGSVRLPATCSIESLLALCDSFPDQANAPWEGVYLLATALCPPSIVSDSSRGPAEQTAKASPHALADSSGRGIVAGGDSVHSGLLESVGNSPTTEAGSTHRLTPTPQLATRESLPANGDLRDTVSLSGRLAPQSWLLARRAFVAGARQAGSVFSTGIATTRRSGSNGIARSGSQVSAPPAIKAADRDCVAS